MRLYHGQRVRVTQDFLDADTGDAAREGDEGYVLACEDVYCDVDMGDTTISIPADVLEPIN